MPRVRYSPAVQEVRGKVGDDVLTRTRSGFVIKSAPRYGYPFVPSQRAAQSRLARAIAAYSALSTPQADAWHAYAETQTRRDPLSGERSHPTAQNAFVGLAMKLLQIDPDATLPTGPPTAPFGGDPPVVTARAEPGLAVFSSPPNGPDTLTELLVQPLASAVRRPRPDRYRSAGFAAFTVGQPEFAVPLSPGFVALAYRSVSSITGQTGVLVPLGTLSIP